MRIIEKSDLALKILNQVEPNGELLDTDQALEAMELYAVEYAKSLKEDKWISVEERLPKLNHGGFSELVMCIDSSYNHHLLRYDFEFKSWNRVFYAGEKVTHWQELPALPSPPKTEK